MKHILLVFVVISTLFYSCSQKMELIDYVNPFVGTSGHGHTFPGATLPFGMVQLSPDTRIDGSWDGCGGYHYSDSIIYGFSFTHLSGTGVSDYGDFMMMPLNDLESLEQKSFGQKFSHDNELAQPGYYSVIFDNKINVELTATLRAGYQRISYPGDKKLIIIDLTHRDKLLDGGFKVIDSHTLAMFRISSAWAQNQHAYAYSEFSQPFTIKYNSDSSKAELSFDGGKELLIKTGFSFVNEEGAKKNLKSEIGEKDFAAIKKSAQNTWNEALAKIEVESSDIEKLKVFYTALYHVMIQPNLAMDVDRQYRGRDNQIHTATDFDYYTVFSLWDTFRAAHPLYTLIDQKRTHDFIKTFLTQYEQGGRLPVWEFASNETDCMIGYHSVSVIADAAKKGITDFDLKLALEAMQKSATWNHLGLPEYINNQYLNIEDEHESVSKTLEYAYDDWCIAQMALIVGDSVAYIQYMKRSQSWKNLLDPETTFMRPRKNGNWLSPFDPHEVNNYFTEGNSWQYSFFVPHDVYGMIDLMGGADKFESKFDLLFTASTQTTGRTQADITGLIGQYAHGNEPSHHMAYLYHYVGRPDKTNQIVRRIINEFYTSKPDGLIGNEDCGQMSAWYVLSSLGLYQVNPGSDYYLLNAPIFDKAIIHFENGKKLEIISKNMSETNQSISNISLNNADYKPFSHINYATLLAGGNLEFAFDSKPYLPENQQFPPKEISTNPIIEAPLIMAPKRTFNDTMLINLRNVRTEGKIYYTTNGSNPDSSSTLYDEPFIINKTMVIKAISYNSKGNASGVSVASFFKKPNNFSVELKSTYNSQYSAGGPEGLIDGIRGDENWRKGDWQGYQGQDFEAIIDMKKVKPVNFLTASFLQDTRSWIIYPKKVEFFISNDGENFTLVGEAVNSIDASDYQSQKQSLTVILKKPVAGRYLKIKAINYGKLPQWHMGAGFDAFIFIDEIEADYKVKIPIIID